LLGPLSEKQWRIEHKCFDRCDETVFSSILLMTRNFELRLSKNIDICLKMILMFGSHHWRGQDKTVLFCLVDGMKRIGDKSRLFSVVITAFWDWTKQFRHFLSPTRQNTQSHYFFVKCSNLSEKCKINESNEDWTMSKLCMVQLLLAHAVSIIHRVRKKEATLFSTINRASLGVFS